MPTALVFAAGLGTRLKPLTDTMPKAMVPVCGEPLIAHPLHRLKAAGFDRAVVNVHHFGQQIIDFLSENDFGIDVAVSDERDCLLDTGGGLRKAAPLLTAKEPSAPILIHNVDILSNADLPAFLAAAQENDVTLLVSRRDTKRYLLFDADNRLCGWTNIETGEVRTPYPDLDVAACKRLAFSGLHVVSPKIFALMQAYPARFPIMDFYLEQCDKLQIRAYEQPGLQLIDVGKLDTLAKAEEFLKNK